MVGFPSDGGVLPSGVTGTTALGISAVWRCLDILANGISQLQWNEKRGNLELPPSRIVIRPQAERTRRWKQIADIYLAQQLSCYPPDYLAQNPSVDRVLEIIENFEEDLFDMARRHGHL